MWEKVVPDAEKRKYGILATTDFRNHMDNMRLTLENVQMASKQIMDLLYKAWVQ